MNSYRVTGLYRRTVASIPALKSLIPVADLRDEPIPFGVRHGHLCPDVMFSRLEDQQGSIWWAKQWLNARQALLQPTWQIERFLATLALENLVLARELSPEHGLVYPFDPGLFASTTILHQWDWGQYFSFTEYVELQSLATTSVRWPGLPKVPVGQLTDLQATRLHRRVVCLDFEPSPSWALRLAGVAIP